MLKTKFKHLSVKNGARVVSLHPVVHFAVRGQYAATLEATNQQIAFACQRQTTKETGL